MIKAIIFDGGGVVVNQKPLMNKFIKIFKPKDKEQFLIELNRDIIPLCKNKISEKEFWEKFAKFMEIPSNKIPKDLWTKDFEKLTKIDKRVVQFIKNLRKNYKIGLISNTIKPHVILNKKRGLFKIFDTVVLSNEVSLTKNNKKIFHIAVKKLKVNPQECIFIDDMKDFVDVAESVGMIGIHFKNFKLFKSQLNKILK